MINLLFLCSGEGARSRTARQLFSQHHGVTVRSEQLGGHGSAKIDRAMFRWADVIVVMERPQRRLLERRFKWSLCAKRIFCLDIRDQFAYMEPALIQLLCDRAITMMPSLLPHEGFLPDVRCAESPPVQRSPSAHEWSTPFQVLNPGTG